MAFGYGGTFGDGGEVEKFACFYQVFINSVKEGDRVVCGVGQAGSFGKGEVYFFKFRLGSEGSDNSFSHIR